MNSNQSGMLGLIGYPKTIPQQDRGYLDACLVKRTRPWFATDSPDAYRDMRRPAVTIKVC